MTDSGKYTGLLRHCVTYPDFDFLCRIFLDLHFILFPCLFACFLYSKEVKYSAAHLDSHIWRHNTQHKDVQHYYTDDKGTVNILSMHLAQWA
jgi:hypothetical protein